MEQINIKLDKKAIKSRVETIDTDNLINASGSKVEEDKAIPSLSGEYINDNQVKKRIILTQLNGVGYCFNAEDYIKIRKDFRITGSFMGSDHSKGYTKKNQMLPVEFNEYETQLMLDENIAILVSKKKSFEKGPSVEAEEHLLNEIEGRMSKQEEALNEKKVQETIKNITKVMAGKRSKLIKNGIPEKDIKLTEDEVIQEMKSNIKFDKKNSLLEIPYQCLYDHEGQIVDFEVKDKLGYKIFYDVWKKGDVYVTLGGNFGANFLIYPGDPMAYHASHVIHVLEKPTIHPLDLIAKCRLTVNVNKICVLAYLDADDNIKYQTIQWHSSKADHFNLETKQNENDYDTDNSEY